MKFINVLVDIPDLDLEADAKGGLAVRLEVHGPKNISANTQALIIGTALDTALRAFLLSMDGGAKCTCGKCPDYVPEKDDTPPVTFGKMPKDFM